MAKIKRVPQKRITDEIKHQILQLFYKSNDNKSKSIMAILGISYSSVIDTINNHCDGKIEFKTDYYVYHSKMNYDEV